MGGYMYDYLDSDRELRDIIINIDDNNISFENIEVTIPQYSEPGTWTLERLYASDVIGNSLDIYLDHEGNYITDGVDEDGNYIEQLIDLDFKTEFEVINSDPDITAPEIKKLEVSEDIFNVTDGDKTFELTANLTDDISGIRNQSIDFEWRLSLIHI